MATDRFNHLPPERQDEILAAAAAEFVRHGYSAASMNRIIRSAHSSKGAFYYYFENKADLLGTVVEEAVARVMAEVDWPLLDELTAASFWDRMQDMLRGSVDLLDNDTWYMRVLRSFYRLREEAGAREATAGIMDRGRELVGAYLQRGRELGVVRDDLPLEMLVEMHTAADEAGDRWMMQHWNELAGREKLALLEARGALVRDMLGA